MAHLGEPRTPRTVFDDFKPAFQIVEYLATSDAMATFLSEVLIAMELVLVAQYPIYHTCKHRDDYSAQSHPGEPIRVPHGHT